MRIKIGKILFAFFLTIFAIRIVAAPIIAVDSILDYSPVHIIDSSKTEKSPLKAWLGDLESSENEEERSFEDSLSESIITDSHVFFNLFSPAVFRHHYDLNSRDLSQNSPLYTSFCTYRI